MQYRMQLSPLLIEGDKEFYKATKYLTKENKKVYTKPTQGLNL